MTERSSDYNRLDVQLNVWRDYHQDSIARGLIDGEQLDAQVASNHTIQTQIAEIQAAIGDGSIPAGEGHFTMTYFLLPKLINLRLVGDGK